MEALETGHLPDFDLSYGAAAHIGAVFFGCTGTEKKLFPFGRKPARLSGRIRALDTAADEAL